MLKVCPNCNTKFNAPPSGRKHCKASCYTKIGATNPKWHGGNLISEGYIYKYYPKHPDATKLGYVLEHRLVMEQHLGRRLKRGEAVHHLNHIRSDNRVANLHLCPSNGKHFIENHLLERDSNGRFYRVQQSVTYSSSS